MAINPANQRPVFRSHGHSGPIRRKYSGHVVNLDQSETSVQRWMHIYHAIILNNSRISLLANKDLQACTGGMQMCCSVASVALAQTKSDLIWREAALGTRRYIKERAKQNSWLLCRDAEHPLGTGGKLKSQTSYCLVLSLSFFLSPLYLSLTRRN